MVELCYELRVPFAKWVTAKQVYILQQFLDLSLIYCHIIAANYHVIVFFNYYFFLFLFVKK